MRQSSRTHQAAGLKAPAAAQSSLAAWLAKLADESSDNSSPRAFKSERGMLAKYGAEEIGENRRDMFRGFAEDL